MAPNLPKKQWAQVFEKTGGKIEYKQIDVPTPGPDEVLVNVKYSGVCHTGRFDSARNIPGCTGCC